jgi:hypothetical protein
MNKKHLSQSIIFNIFVILSIFSSFFNTSAYDNQVTLAYLDPGTGSMIISAIVGVLATIVLGVKTFWYKIKTLFGFSVKKTSNPPAEQKNTDVNKS